MGQRSRRKRERRNRPDPGPTPRQQFQAALIVGAVEDIRDHGKPYLLCGASTRDAGVWFPAPAYSRYLGGDPDRTRVIVYPVCRACNTGLSTDQVEARTLTEHRARLAARDAGLPIADGFVPFGCAADAARFAEAFERHAPPSEVSP